MVDDNRDSADSLALLLQMSGHEVRTAHDGPSVLLDIGLPVMNGYEVARRMRALHPLQGTLLIAQTGWGQAEDCHRSQEAGFDQRFFGKPVDFAALQSFRGMLLAAPAIGPVISPLEPRR